MGAGLFFLRLDLLYGGPGGDVFDPFSLRVYPDPDVVLRVLLQAGEGIGGLAGLQRLRLQDLRETQGRTFSFHLKRRDGPPFFLKHRDGLFRFTLPAEKAPGLQAGRCNGADYFFFVFLLFTLVHGETYFFPSASVYTRIRT